MKYLSLLVVCATGCGHSTHGPNVAAQSGKYQLVATFKGNGPSITTDPFVILGSRVKIRWNLAEDGGPPPNLMILLRKGSQDTEHFATSITATGEAVFYDSGTFNIKGSTFTPYTLEVFDFR